MGIGNRKKLTALRDPEIDRLLRLVTVAQRVALGILCATFLVWLPAAWIISAGCDSGQFVTICP